MPAARIFLALIYLLAAQTVVAQNTKPVIYEETPPKFLLGDAAMFRIVTDSMVYPPAAKKDRIGGKVVVQFIVNKAGNIDSVKVVEGIREDLDAEAERLVRLLVGWTPGIQNGKPVNVQFRLPMYFYPDERYMRRYKRQHRPNTVPVN